MKHRLVASFTALSLLAGPALAVTTTTKTPTTTHKAKPSKHSNAKKQNMKATPAKTTK